MRRVIIGSLLATAMVLTGCGDSDGTTNLVIRGSENPSGTHPGQVRAIAGVAVDACQAWLLDFPSFGGGLWEMHLRVSTSRSRTLRQRLSPTAGVESIKIDRNPSAPSGTRVVRTTCATPPH